MDEMYYMIDVTELLSMKLCYEIDKDILVQIWESSGVEESQIKEYVTNMDMKFENKIYRFEHSLTNKDVHCR